MCRILLIDDDDCVREALALMLESLGHDVSSAQDGTRGIALYRAGEFDLVITDIVMPDKEGLEVIMELRHADPSACIIAISGGARRVTSGSCLQSASLLGAKAVLQKPFGLKDLRAAVDAAVEAAA